MNKSLHRLLFAFSFLMLFSAFAAAQSRSSVSGAEVTGTFEMKFANKKFKDYPNRLETLALGGGKLKVAFDLLYPYTLDNENGPMSAHLGSIEGEASITGDTAILESDESGPCKITLTFVRPGEVKVTQGPVDATCGFGHNVTSAGTYKKVSGKKPKFGGNK